MLAELKCRKYKTRFYCPFFIVISAAAALLLHKDTGCPIKKGRK